MTRFMHWYMDRVLRLATREVAVRSVLLQVFNLLIPPPALFRRQILFAVIRDAVLLRVIRGRFALANPNRFDVHKLADAELR